MELKPEEIPADGHVECLVIAPFFAGRLHQPGETVEVGAREMKGWGGSYPYYLAPLRPDVKASREAARKKELPEPEPGTPDAMMAEARDAQIRRAVELLDPSDDTHWTRDTGKPMIASVVRALVSIGIVNTDVDRAAINHAVGNDYRRPKTDEAFPE